MRESQSKEIGASTYHVQPLGAGKGRSLSVKIARMGGPALRGGWSFANRSEILGAIGDVLVNANEPDIEALVALLVDATLVEVETGSGKRVPLKSVMELHFAGALHEQVQWIQFSLEVHLGPLADWLASQLAAGETEKSKSNSPTASGGPSTE